MVKEPLAEEKKSFLLHCLFIRFRYYIKYQTETNFYNFVSLPYLD